MDVRCWVDAEMLGCVMAFTAASGSIKNGVEKRDNNSVMPTREARAITK